jgi:hypothetical protein
MNRALWKPALLTAIVLVVATTSGLLIRGNTGSDISGVSNTDESAPKDAEAPKVAETPQAVPALRAGENPKAAVERRQLLEIVGTLTAAHCHEAYFNISLLADGKAKGTYTDQDAHKVLDSFLALLLTVDQKLAALGKLDLDKEDRESLEEMRLLSDLLRQQGKELEAFWDSGSDEDAARYESARKDSWAAINKLTGVGR